MRAADDGFWRTSVEHTTRSAAGGACVACRQDAQEERDLSQRELQGQPEAPANTQGQSARVERRRAATATTRSDAKQQQRQRQRTTNGGREELQKGRY